MKTTDIQITDADCTIRQHDYRSPMKFGGRVVRDVVLFDVYVEVRTRDGKYARGTGSMTMGNIWAWPAGQTDPQQSLERMLQFGREVVREVKGFSEFGHPVELMYDFSKHYERIATSCRPDDAEVMPKLAMLVAASPLEAAVFDAFGRVHGQNVYNLLSEEYCNRDISHYLGDDFQGEYFDRYTLRHPQSRMPLYHLVGALDPLSEADVAAQLDDGLPEHLTQWIPYNGLTHIKIKLNGDDLSWDVDRVLAVDKIAEEAQAKRNCSQWYYSADFNERCENVEYVLDFLRQIEERAPKAIERLQYIEQPTNRNLKMFPENRMHKAAKIKPVVIDESLVDLDSFYESRKMGYSGVALKACKGLTESLIIGAAAQKSGAFLCVQDLTCVGASFLLSATLSARIPTVSAIEGNGRQYCPAANFAWQDRYPTMFNVKDGTLGTAVLDEIGLGFSPPDFTPTP